MSKTQKVLLETCPYRFTTCGELPNGRPDYRLQKFDNNTSRYKDIYLFDNQMQMMTAMEDIDYCRWLDPDGVPCYNKPNGNYKNPYP